MDRPAEFPFVAGALSLALVDTRSRGAGLRESLAEPADLGGWLQAAGLCLGVSPTARGLEAALALREAIYRAALAASAGRAPEPPDVVTINRAAAEPPLRPQLAASATHYIAAAPVTAALSTLAADAIAILGQPERIRECPDCRMLFFDASRPRRRKWCSSASGCGNRAKVRRHRARHTNTTGE